MELTPLDMKALKQADRVVFSYHCEKAILRCIKRVENDPYETERQYEITIDSNRFQNYGKLTTITSAFAFLSSAKYSELWNTVLQIIRPGDSLQFVWIVDNNSSLLEEMGLHNDAFQLIIQRGNKAFAMQIASSICPSNSARMIQGY
jgi:hypothetical protein